ncbi:MAG: hypothetical protein AAFO04_22085 [Cyanobacteria bacterium J06592_8]
MPRATYGPKVEARAKYLLEVLLLFVKGEVENSDRFDIKYSWLEDQQFPQLRIETNLRTLEALTNAYRKPLKKSQIRESLKRMDDFLNILKDERVIKKGSEDWRFTLTLWSKDINENLQKFSQEWDRYRPQGQDKTSTELDFIPDKYPNAYHLERLLEENLEKLNESEEKQLNQAIETAFRYCDPSQDWIEGNRLEKLIKLSQVSYPGWSEVDGLIQFAVILATLTEDFTGNFGNQIRTYIETIQPPINFEELLSKARKLYSKNKTESEEKSLEKQAEHLIVEVIPQEQSEGVRVSIWEIGNLSSPLIQDEIMPLDELPNFLETWLEEESELIEPTLHLFVPRKWLNLDLSDRMTESELTLGSQYKLVMRTHLNLTPTGKRYSQLLQEKWQLLETKIQQKAQTSFVHADCSSPAQLFQTLKPVEMAILENWETAKFGKVLEFVAKKTALPVALWSRRCELSDRVDDILDCKVGQLPERIFQERFNSLTADENHIGHHLTLVWEDPNIVPPTLQLN